MVSRAPGSPRFLAGLASDRSLAEGIAGGTCQRSHAVTVLPAHQYADITPSSVPRAGIAHTKGHMCLRYCMDIQLFNVIRCEIDAASLRAEQN